MSGKFCAQTNLSIKQQVRISKPRTLKDGAESVLCINVSKGPVDIYVVKRVDIYVVKRSQRHLLSAIENN